MYASSLIRTKFDDDDGDKSDNDSVRKRALYRLVKRTLLAETESTFCAEIKISPNEADILNDSDMRLMVAQMLQVNTGILVPSKLLAKSPIFYDVQFKKFYHFVMNSLNIYKLQMLRLLYRVFEGTILKIVELDNVDRAKKLLTDVNLRGFENYRRDIESLRNVIIENKFEDYIESQSDRRKLFIRMSTDCYLILTKYLENEGKYIAEILTANVDIETCDILPKLPFPFNRFHVNENPIQYGLLIKPDVQKCIRDALLAISVEQNTANGSKPDGKLNLSELRELVDANASNFNRIQLPKLSVSNKKFIQKFVHASQNCLILNKKLPSIFCYKKCHVNITCAEFSENTKVLALGYTDGSIRIEKFNKNLLNGMRTLVSNTRKRYLNRHRMFYGHSGEVYRVAFAPYCNQLVSCSADRTIRLWSLQTWRCLAIYKHSTSSIRDVCFAPFGFYFAACSFKSAKLYTTYRITPKRIFLGHLSDVETLQFHPNSNYLATGSSDRSIRLWDIKNGQTVRLLAGHVDTVTVLVFSKCGRFLISGGNDMNIIIWDLENGAIVQILQNYAGSINDLAFSRCGNILSASESTNQITLWDFGTLRAQYLKVKNDFVDLDGLSSYFLRSYKINLPIFALNFNRENILIAITGNAE